MECPSPHFSSSPYLVALTQWTQGQIEQVISLQARARFNPIFSMGFFITLSSFFLFDLFADKVGCVGEWHFHFPYG